MLIGLAIKTSAIFNFQSHNYNTIYCNIFQEVYFVMFCFIVPNYRNILKKSIFMGIPCELPQPVAPLQGRGAVKP